jgi:hypothetical protein
VNRSVVILSSILLTGLAGLAVWGPPHHHATARADTVGVSAVPYGPPATDITKQLTLDQARSFTPFALYSVGPAYASLARSGIQRTLRSPSETELAEGITTWMNTVDFIYGDCSAQGSDTGCSPPLDVQVWPACDRSLSLYPSDAPYQKVTINGATGAQFQTGDGGGMLEMYLGKVTVVIFGSSPKQEQDVAANLTPVNAPAVQAVAAAGTGLPTPAAGSLSGALTCTTAERSS